MRDVARAHGDASDGDADATGRRCVVTLDRPERRNAVDHATLLGLLRRPGRLAAGGPGARADRRAAGVLRRRRPDRRRGGRVRAALLGAVLRGFTELPIPTIAAVDGPALGAGTQLAVACDLRVATPASRFGIPAARLGLVVDHWTVERLARELGWPIARAMLLAAETYDGAALHADRRRPPPRRARRRAGVGPPARRAGAADDRRPQAGPRASAPARPATTLVEAARQRRGRSADAVEGRQAFLAKRPPASPAPEYRASGSASARARPLVGRSRR